MRIGKIKLMQLKYEHLDSLEGQGELINIIDNNICSSEQVEYGEGDSNIGDIAVEAYYENLYSTGDLKNIIMFHDLFLGNESFQYNYSRWEIELKTKNPTKDEIAKHIVNTWYYEISPDETEEIENIATNYAHSYHDDASLRYITPDRVKDIYSDFSKEIILGTAKELEKVLNSFGIFVEEFNEQDIKLIDDIEKLFRKSAEDNTGIIYVISY